jgi:hypothetical protein
MAAPRVTINDLPEKTAPVAADLFVLQDGTTTKKVTWQHLYDGTGIAAHIAAATNAHAATAVSVVPAPGIVATNVQAALSEVVGRVITTTAPLTGGGSLQTNRTLGVDMFGAFNPGVVPASGGSPVNFLRADGQWAVPEGGSGGGGSGGGGTGITDGDKIDIFVSGAGSVWQIKADTITASELADASVDQAALVDKSVTNAKLADAAATSLKGNNTATTAPVADLNPSQVKLMLSLDQVSNTSDTNKPVFTSSFSGAVPATGGSTGRFLRDDGTWQAGSQGDPGPAGGSILSAFWQFSSTTTAPPGSGQVRSDAGFTTLWVHETDTDGFDRTLGLNTVTVNSTILVRASNGTAVDLKVTGTPVDSGVYRTIPVTVTSGSITKGARTQLNFILSTDIPTNVIRGRISAGTGPIEQLTPLQARTVIASDSGGGTTNFLRADGSWAPPPGGAGGGIAGVAIQEDDVTKAAAATTIDFGNAFDVTESPTNEANVTLNLAEYTGTQLPNAKVAGLSAAATMTLPVSVANGGTGQTAPGPALSALGGVALNGALGTPTSGTLTNCASLPVSGITPSTSTALGVGSVELGHATDTTLSRSAAGKLAVEGVDAVLVSGAQTLTNKTLTSPTINTPTLNGSGGALTLPAGPDTLVGRTNTFSTTTTTAGVVPGSNNGGASVYLNGNGAWTSPGATGPTGPPGIVQGGSAPGDVSVLWADTSQVGIEENVRYLSNVTGTAYTLVLGDRGKLLLCSNAAAQTVTIPTNATAAFVIGTQLDIVQMGAGTVSVAVAGGVTINGGTTALSFSARYAGVSLIKTATNDWLALGSLG